MATDGGTPVAVNELIQALVTAVNAAPAAAPAPDPALSAPTTANRFNPVARTADEQTNVPISIPNWKRATLKPVDLEKLRVNATKGISKKFSLMSVSGSFVDGVELLKENIVATALIDRVEEHCRAYGMEEVFDIVKPPGAGGIAIDPEATKSLFTHYSTLPKEAILASVSFYRSHVQAYDLENLSWSEQFLSNCCDETLRAKLDERMASYTSSQRGGPSYFYEMMQAIMTMTTEGATLMKEKLRTLTMQDFAGEDVHKAATLIRGTVKRLEMINDVPADLSRQVIKIFLTCSVPEFVRVFSTIDSLHTVGGLVGGVKYTAADLVEVAESAYLKLSTVWNIDPTDKPTSFVANQNRNGVTCWGCGQKGHSLHDCPHKTEAEKKIIFEERKQRKGGKGGGSGNGNNGGGDSNNSGKTPKNPNSNNTLCKIPSKDGEDHTKVINGVERKWCNICKLWNKSHHTSGHTGRRPAANNVSDSGSGESGSAAQQPKANFAQQIRSQLGQQRS